MTALRILGTFLWLLRPPGSTAPAAHAIAFWQAVQPQQNEPNASSQQSSAAPQPPDQQETPAKPAPQPPTAASPLCPQNSQPGSTVKADCTPQKANGARTRKHKTHAAEVPAATGPTKTVVRNGGTPEPTIDLSPRVSQQQTSHQLEETNQRLAAADANLKKIAGRQLSASQQDTLKQIKSYLVEAKAAKDGGDVQRAYNLAVKANLLSAELAGH